MLKAISVRGSPTGLPSESCPIVAGTCLPTQVDHALPVFLPEAKKGCAAAEEQAPSADGMLPAVFACLQHLF